MSRHGWAAWARHLVALGVALVLLAALLPARAQAQHAGGDITVGSAYGIDPTGGLTLAQVQGGALPLQQLDRHRAFPLGAGALWLRLDVPARDPGQPWYLLLSGAPFINSATLFTPQLDGSWRAQRAGDHVPVAQWDQPNTSPLFAMPAEVQGTVWLRIANQPAPTNPYVQLLSAQQLEAKRQWTHLLVGGYLGFGLLVFIVGLIHGRLYGDRVFDVYCLYVACMLMFQLAFTGVGGLFMWPQWARFNDAAPALFMLVMTGSGIWFIREATSLQRHSRAVDRGAMAFSAFGLVFAGVYLVVNNPVTYAVLNLYGLASVVLSISLCLWTWRRGERYSGWLFLGFLPIHLAYPFPALRAAGVLPDSWATQYAVLIGSAIEIPLLLYILHWRAKDFSEHRVRLRALDSTDPLTGLTIVPVLRLRLRDALRRARRAGHRCTVVLVEVANHADLAASGGREGGDRALVVAASRLSQVVREVDTVCRIADTRFALLVEGPQTESGRKLLAQHIIARGLEPAPQLGPDGTLRFRLVSALVPDGAIELAADGGTDEQRLLLRLGRALDQLLAGDPRRVVHHVETRPAELDAATTLPG